MRLPADRLVSSFAARVSASDTRDNPAYRFAHAGYATVTPYIILCDTFLVTV
jgi:hypothetical protein